MLFISIKKKLSINILVQKSHRRHLLAFKPLVLSILTALTFTYRCVYSCNYYFLALSLTSAFFISLSVFHLKAVLFLEMSTQWRRTAAQICLSDLLEIRRLSTKGKVSSGEDKNKSVIGEDVCLWVLLQALGELFHTKKAI